MEKLHSNEKEIAPINIEDIEGAMDFIAERFEKGERPVITIPEEYLDSLERGLKPHETWVPGAFLTAGTFASEPYFPMDGTGNSNRLAIRINKISLGQIKPRFTGPDNAFHGVVVLEGPIPPEAIEIIK